MCCSDDYRLAHLFQGNPLALLDLAAVECGLKMGPASSPPLSVAVLLAETERLPLRVAALTMCLPFHQ